MIRKRGTRNSSRAKRTPASEHLDAWVLSLPWVVQLPSDARWPDVRLFAVDCEPLQRRRVWLVTGLAEQTPRGDTDSAALAAVMRDHPSRAAQAAGWVGHPTMPLPAGHVLVTLGAPAAHQRDAIETFVLAAYDQAMS